MIKINGEIINLDNYPDGTMLVKYDKENHNNIKITWLYESDKELFALICLTKHLKGTNNKIHLDMPYIPNARMDRSRSSEDVFTLKYFAEVINWLKFDSVTVLDPHSSVSEALINNIIIRHPDKYVWEAINNIKKSYEDETDNFILFFPDEGSMKRYATRFNLPYAFGVKQRDWKTGVINGLDVAGMTDLIKDSNILIVDDICSKGGTFYYSAKKLKELGAKDIYLYVSHCENTILEGNVLNSGLVEKVYTTNSIFTKEHEKITVMNTNF